MMNAPFSHWLTESRFRVLGLIWLGLLLLAGLGLAALWLGQRLHVQTDIYALLPSGNYAAEVRLANQRGSYAVNKKIFVLLVASRKNPDPSDSRKKATEEFLTSAKTSG